MADLTRLKGSYDLAQMNHGSLQTEDSEAAMLAAKDVYELAVAQAQQETDALEAFGDQVTDAEIEDAQRKLDALKRAKGMPVGPTRKKAQSADAVAGKVEVAPNRQPSVVPSQTNPAVEVVVSPATTNQDPTSADGGAGQGEPSDATKVALEIAATAEKKSE